MVDFMQNTNNVYSTAHHIVAQNISIMVDENDVHRTVTIDTFYRRNKIRDKQYALAFVTESIVTGGRINCDITKRKYVN